MIDFIRRSILRFLFPEEVVSCYLPPNSEFGQVPIKAYSGDAGWDLSISADVCIAPRSFMDMPIELHFKIPPTMWIRITGRSSTFRNHGLQVQEGIIDSGFTGQIFIGVYNTTGNPIKLPKGTRLAQAIPHRHVDFRWERAHSWDDILSVGGRGSNGFGSSGEGNNDTT